MIRTEKMVQLSAVVLEKYQSQVVKRLVELGQLDFISVREIDPAMAHSLQNVKQEVALPQIKDLRRKIEGIMISGEIDFPEIPKVSDNFALASDFDKISTAVARISEDVSSIKDEQRLVQSDLLRLEEMQKQVEAALKAKQKIKKGQENIYASHLVVRTGSLANEGAKNQLLSAFREFTFSLFEKSADKPNEFYLIHLKSDLQRFDTILDDSPWTHDEVLMGDSGIDDELKNQLALKIKLVMAQQKELQFKLENEIATNKNEIQTLWKALRVAETYEAIEQQFNRTDKTFVFSGWITAKMKKKVAGAIMEICGNDCYIEFASAETVKEELGLEPPVQLKTPKLLKPFEKVITDFSIPAYGTLNPAFIVSITFLVMFGMMFGDVGHGFVIFLGSLIGILVGKKKKKSNPLFNLMLYCGLSAMVFGALFGSYFGYSPVNGLLFNYHGAVMGEHTHGFINDIMGVLALATWFGVAIISLGLLFNFYNCIVQKRWLTLFTDKNGIAGAVMYWCGVYLATLFMTGKEFDTVPMPLIIICFAFGMIAIIVRLVIESIHEKGGFKFTAIPMIIMEFLIEMLEVFSGYLANTLSFLRVAGLGIAHVSLMAAFSQLAGMVGTDSVGAMIGYVLIMLLGNVLVIGLEGLSAWIQTLRLHYYEFFSKFLVGGGIAYRPINLSDKRD